MPNRTASPPAIPADPTDRAADGQPLDPDLDPAAARHPLVLAEFAYLGQCAFQANEDRARAPQLFGVTLATLAAALYSFKTDGLDGAAVRLVYGLLFGAEAVMGWLTLRQLARLRLSWLSAITAQDRIKRRAVRADAALEGWFAWAEAPLPAAYNRGSVGWLMAAGVAVLTGLGLGCTVFLWAPAILDLGGARRADAATLPGALGLSAQAGLALLLSGACAALAFRHGYRRPLQASQSGPKRARTAR